MSNYVRNSNSLNEELKRREAGEQKKENNGRMTLDDTQRVKVLSPGRLVAKRFFRNKLAIVGLAILIFMFAFAFVAPLFYPYGQTEVFYKYDQMLVDYGIVNERTEYVSHILDNTVEIPRSVKNMMTSYISTMQKDNLSEYSVFDNDGNPYVVNRLGEGVYCLSMGEMETVAELPSARVIGQLNKITGELKASVSADELPEGFAEKCAACLKSNTMSFKMDGVEYVIEKGSTKVAYNVKSTSGDSLIFEGEDLGAEFTEAFKSANDAGEASFMFGGKQYSFIRNDEGVKAALKGDSEPVIVASYFAFDAFEAGTSFSDRFIAEALLNLYDGGKFEDDGTNYKIDNDDESFVIRTSSGEDVAMLSNVVVRRYDGTDTLSIDFKQAVADVVTDMREQGLSESRFNFVIPELDDTGAYLYDENGELVYGEKEILVEKKLDNFVLRCKQTTYLIDIYADPSPTHPFGTDADGMDILARMMYGGRISLMVGFVVVFLECILGIIMGGLAGFFGGWVDTVIMRLVDIFYCIPTYPILIILGATFDAMRLGSYQRLIWMMAVLGILGWAGVARLVRGQILSLREQEFMVAQEATGVRVSRRIFKHLVPNVMPQLIVSATMGLGSVIITESTLSFLGLGVKRPLATWGTMINAITSSNENLVRYAYIWIPVGLLICLTVIAFNFVGDGLRDAFDPKMKQ